MSNAEHMSVSPSQLSPHTKSYLCPTQATLENNHECGNSEQKHKLESEIIRTEARDSRTAVLQSTASKTLQPSAEDVAISCPTDLELPSEDARESAPFDKSSSPNQSVEDQKLEPVSACPRSESSKGIDIIILQDEKRDSNTDLSSFMTNETPLASLEGQANNSLTEDMPLPHVDASKSSQIDNSPDPQQTISGPTLEFHSDSACCEPPEERQKLGTESSSDIVVDNFGFAVKQMGLHPDDSICIPSNKQIIPPHDNLDKQSSLEHVETSSGIVVGISSRTRPRIKRTPKFSRKKYVLRSLRRSDRVLRSKSQEKPKAPESSGNIANGNSNGEKKRKKRKKRRGKNTVADEYSKGRARLRYLLNRMSYEQSLITAYSGEGWKGLSLEKLKPEKELQRATSEIIRRKLKIRDLFQRIDSLCGEGRFPASFFDSDGQIDSEDIFCAKCGSKDLTADNDIILCDGTCDRGFHQFCLAPPLLKEEIPPDDEGWLCPGCDCKVDCIELLNDSQGTNISIDDSFEKVFPEAVAAAAGKNLDHNFGLSSDDSDDNDYDPDCPDIDGKSLEVESSSDESDFTSTSDELDAPPDDKQYLGLPSDDSEDDNYDPDAPDLEENLKPESSISDFVSDSEDLDGLSVEDEGHMSIGPCGDSYGERSKFSGKKKQSLNGEQSILEPSHCQDEFPPVSGRRNVERLDYKKLYDETYGNIATSSDDDYSDTFAPRKRRKNTADFTKMSADQEAFVTQTVMSSKNMDTKLKENEHTSERSTRQKSNFQETRVSPAKSQAGASPSGSSCKGVRPSSYKRLGEAVTQKLYSSFKENQYPDRAAKARLAAELGITFEQVNKWFTNARWSFNHSSPTGTSIARSGTSNGSCDGHVKDGEPKNQKNNKRRHNAPKSSR